MAKSIKRYPKNKKNKTRNLTKYTDNIDDISKIRSGNKTIQVTISKKNKKKGNPNKMTNREYQLEKMRIKAGMSDKKVSEAAKTKRALGYAAAASNTITQAMSSKYDAQKAQAQYNADAVKYRSQYASLINGSQDQQYNQDNKSVNDTANDQVIDSFY